MFTLPVFLVIIFLVMCKSETVLPVDPSCVTFLKPTRDYADYFQVFKQKTVQKCKLLLGGGGGVGVFSYSLNSNKIPRITTAIATITAANLDKGVPAPNVAQVFINYFSRGDTPGLILGTKLGTFAISFIIAPT